MPVEVTKYTCAFRCGHKAVGGRAVMMSHEAKCWRNPETKSCSTCVFEEYYNDTDGTRHWMNRGCKHPNVDDEELERLILESEYHKKPPVFHIRPVRNCPYHKAKK